ncbi:MAG: NTP transferase domain-containing protein [Acidilobaceae archaeon]
MSKLDCIIMAGGRGERMGFIAKPLLELCSKPIILWVVEALRSICSRIIIVYSRWTSQIRDYCSGALGIVECIEGEGEGYVKDLRLALNLVTLPALIAPSDIPFLKREILEDFITKALIIPQPIVNLYGPQGPTGVSLFKSYSGEWANIEISGGYTLIDVDTWRDYEEARRICLELMGGGLLKA